MHLLRLGAVENNTGIKKGGYIPPFLKSEFNDFQLTPVSWLSSC